MALDFTNIIDLPDYLQFDTYYEPSRMHDKKYAINTLTGEVLGIVGSNFNCGSHQEFTNSFAQPLFDKLSDDDVKNMDMKISTARNNAFMKLDMTFPTTEVTLRTNTNHIFKLALRIVALHGVDGLCSNQVYFGAIDWICDNGQVTGEHDKIRKKNTSGFRMHDFLSEIENMNFDFKRHTSKLQDWANIPLPSRVYPIIEHLINSERKAKKMYDLYNAEVQKRGRNLYALYSAFTNYSTYADERNGFKERNTGKDTKAVTMWKREEEVSKWVSSPQFKALTNA